MNTPEPVVSISVVIPAYGECPHLDDVLSALLVGDNVPTEIIVSHSGPFDPTERIGAAFETVTVLHARDRLFAGAARNRGAAAATSSVLAFCDADTVPNSGWLLAIVEALDVAPRRFVVGAVGVARSGGYWGLSNWLLEFSEQAPWRPGGAQTGGASCNMAVRSEMFHAVGGFPGRVAVGEDTALFANLRASGVKQIFVPGALVEHFNNSGFRAFARHQTGLGRAFANLRFSRDMKGSFAVRRPVLALGLFLPKAAFVMKRTFGRGLRPLGLGLMLFPGVLIGSVIWSWACFLGARHLISESDQGTSG